MSDSDDVPNDAVSVGGDENDNIYVGVNIEKEVRGDLEKNSEKVIVSEDAGDTIEGNRGDSEKQKIGGEKDYELEERHSEEDEIDTDKKRKPYSLPQNT